MDDLWLNQCVELTKNCKIHRQVLEVVPASTQLRQQRVKCTRLTSAANVRVNQCFMLSLSLSAVDIAMAAPDKGKGSPYSTADRRVPELIPVLGSQPAGDVSHKPGGMLPLLSARPAVTQYPRTLKRAVTSFTA